MSPDSKVKINKSNNNLNQIVAPKINNDTSSDEKGDLEYIKNLQKALNDAINQNDDVY